MLSLATETVVNATADDLEEINALEQRPPFVNQFDLPTGTLGYDPANASLLGRQVSL